MVWCIDEVNKPKAGLLGTTHRVPDKLKVGRQNAPCAGTLVVTEKELKEPNWASESEKRDYYLVAAQNDTQAKDRCSLIFICKVGHYQAVPATAAHLVQV